MKDFSKYSNFDAKSYVINEDINESGIMTENSIDFNDQ